MPSHAFSYVELMLLIASVLIFEFTLPRITLLWISSRVSEAINQINPTCDRSIAVADYDEDSLIFLTGGRAERIEVSDVDHWLDSKPDSLLLIANSRVDASAVREITPIAGLNYSRGQRVDLSLVEAASRANRNRTTDRRSGRAASETNRQPNMR